MLEANKSFKVLKSLNREYNFSLKKKTDADWQEMQQQWIQDMFSQLYKIQLVTVTG